jgi:fumarate reductase subunit C
MDRLDILSNFDNPRELEKLYQDNKTVFKTEFNLIYPELTDNKVADYWNERLNYESSEISWGSKNELIFVLVASLLAGVIAKLPAILNIDAESFYQRNIGFIVFPILTTYFIWKNGLSTKKIVFAGASFLISLAFINLLPADNKSNTLILSCIHLPLFLWAVLGLSYVGDNSGSYHKRLDFLRYNGDLVIMATLILISGGILTAATIGLFNLIGFKIEKFYTDYIVVFGLAAVPVVATFITQTNPQLVNRVSPVIAKIFSPLVLITLVMYLAAILFAGKDPYKDRDFLLVFNFLLIGVMAIILFSVAETFKQNENRIGSFILFALSIVTVIVNGIALSAILFRISEWGFTPNRLAVLGGNILMLIHLLIVTFKLFKNVSKKADVSEVEKSIAMFLPVYIIWALVVTFVFPFMFEFK